MDIRQARTSDLDSVFEVVQDTILSAYPRYYPDEAVAFFTDLHSRSAINEDIGQGAVWVIEDQGRIIGTGTVLGCGIFRVFITASSQGKGYGSSLLDHLESIVAKSYPKAQVDVSLPAFNLYLHRGYDVASGDEIAVENGKILFYASMEKDLGSL